MTQERNETDPKEIAEALEALLASSYFRSSQQCQTLLRYIVEHTVAGDQDCLKERVIGAELFGRRPDYDTGNDHIVRSRVSDVRKRLAQFYVDPVSEGVPRIVIPSGTYRALFQAAPARAVPVSAAVETALPESVAAPVFADTPAEPNVLPSKARRGTWWPVAAAAIVLLALALWLVAHRRSRAADTAFEQFWAPLTHSPKPVLIYCGGGYVYKFSDAYLDKYKASHPVDGDRREFFVQLGPGDQLSGADLVPNRHFTPFGDLVSTARIVSVLTRANELYDIRFGDDVAFTELRSSPTVLVGGLNNRWTMRLMKDLRFVLQNDDSIADREHPEKTRVFTEDTATQVQDDYAIVSRLSDSETGGFVLSIAGIRMYATRAATDFIADPQQMETVLRNAPAHWDKHNLQLVLHTHVVNDIPVRVTVEETHFW